MPAPRADQFEVSVIGPGFGECILVHIGDGRWITVDSCLNKDGTGPAALDYLSMMNVAPDAVELVIATHYHDDHIRGLATLLEACENAKFATGIVTTKHEFLTLVDAYNDRPMTIFGPGLAEMHSAFRLPRKVVRLTADQRIMYIADGVLSHGQSVEIWSLSPCDAAVQRFMQSIETMIPRAREPKRRAPVIKPNECSVVLWIRVGETVALLGADLEEPGPAHRGWSAIVGSLGRPIQRASLFKIPHHGSSNAHSDDVWRTLLTFQPTGVLAPFGKGSKLPTPPDVARILQLAPRSFSTAKMKLKRRHYADAAVEKIVRDLGPSDLAAIEPSIGRVEARIDVAPAAGWQISLYNGAVDLARIHE